MLTRNEKFRIAGMLGLSALVVTASSQYRPTWRQLENYCHEMGGVPNIETFDRYLALVCRVDGKKSLMKVIR